MTRQQPESKLVNQIKAAVKGRYPSALVIKIHGGPYQQQGLPDLFILVDGRFYGIEVKVPGQDNTVTKIQANMLQQIQDAGGVSGVATSPEEALAIISD